jgi:uncharacterized membrane protein AbrB (regulator of aidB expression)
LLDGRFDEQHREYDDRRGAMLARLPGAVLEMTTMTYRTGAHQRSVSCSTSQRDDHYLFVAIVTIAINNQPSQR